MHFVDTLKMNFLCPSKWTYKVHFQSIYKGRIKCTYCGGKPKIAAKYSQRTKKIKHTKPWLCRQQNNHNTVTNANESRNAESVGHGSKLWIFPRGNASAAISPIEIKNRNEVTVRCRRREWKRKKK